MEGLEAAGIGWPVGPEPHQVVPIVPAAVIFDLGRGGEFSNRPTHEFGRAGARCSAAEVGLRQARWEAAPAQSAEESREASATPEMAARIRASRWQRPSS